MTEIRDELWLLSPAGVLQAPGIPVTSFDWTLEENSFHVLHASGSFGGQDDIDPALFALDARLEVHRFLDGQAVGIEGDTQFLLRYWDLGEDGQGHKMWSMEAYSPEYALTGRIVDSYASTEGDVNPLTTKNDPGDDLQKHFVDENIGPSTSLAARKNTEITVEAVLGAATTTDKSAAWDQLFTVLQDLSDDEAYRGDWLSFGLVASGSGTGFTFRTWKDKRGQDHTAGTADEVLVSQEAGNLRAPKIFQDHRQEFTAVRALGKGEGRARATVRVEDTTRSGASPWAYREAKLETQAETTATLTAEANAELQRGQPTIGFTGKFIDTDYARYGQKVKFGDLVTAQYFGYSFACRVQKVSGAWSSEGETLDIELSGSIPA